jgi:protein-S-isoprenylcysteine O-methyltransferase Ste14
MPGDDAFGTRCIRRFAIAQALLLPNGVAGFEGLVGFGTLYFGRVAREERMMLESFGDSYRAYTEPIGKIFPSIR